MEKTCGILPNMIPMRDIKQISDGDRLFFELGYKIDINIWDYGENWVRTGKFIEVTDIQRMIKNDNLIENLDYLEHHNFMLIKKE